MPPEPVVQTYLARLDVQRETIFGELAMLDPECLWHRPGPKEWCAGEHLAHAPAVFRFFRRMFSVMWVILSPSGRLRRDRPYQVDIDDVYARPDFPLSFSWPWPPRVSPEQPVSLAYLYDLHVAEHAAVRRFYEGKDEAVLGNTQLYDPAIGRLNMIQALRVGLHHDEHHFDTVRRILQARP